MTAPRPATATPSGGANIADFEGSASIEVAHAAEAIDLAVEARRLISNPDEHVPGCAKLQQNKATDEAGVQRVGRPLRATPAAISAPRPAAKHLLCDVATDALGFGQDGCVGKSLPGDRGLTAVGAAASSSAIRCVSPFEVAYSMAEKRP